MGYDDQGHVDQGHVDQGHVDQGQVDQEHIVPSPRERRTRFSYLEHGGPEGLRLDALLRHPDGGHCVRCLMYSVTSEGKSDDEPATVECLLKKLE